MLIGAAICSRSVLKSTGERRLAIFGENIVYDTLYSCSAWRLFGHQKLGITAKRQHSGDPEDDRVPDLRPVWLSEVSAMPTCPAGVPRYKPLKRPFSYPIAKYDFLTSFSLTENGVRPTTVDQRNRRPAVIGSVQANEPLGLDHLPRLVETRHLSICMQLFNIRRARGGK